MQQGAVLAAVKAVSAKTTVKTPMKGANEGDGGLKHKSENDEVVDK